mgnify:CR=1 FL=1
MPKKIGNHLSLSFNPIDEVDIKDELLTRGDYFYLPAKVLHIDGDEDYLNRCLKFYKNFFQNRWFGCNDTSATTISVWKGGNYYENLQSKGLQ